MLPADQRFGADAAALSAIHLGLVIEAELPRLHRLGEPLEGSVARLDALLDPGVEQPVAVLAGLLGRVHRVVGVTKQGVRVG